MTDLKELEREEEIDLKQTTKQEKTREEEQRMAESWGWEVELREDQNQQKQGGKQLHVGWEGTVPGKPTGNGTLFSGALDSIMHPKKE